MLNQNLINKDSPFPVPPVKTRGKNDVPYYLYLVVHAYQVRSSTVDSPLNLGPAQLANRNSAWELKFSASAYRANYVSCIIAKAISIHYILCTSYSHFFTGALS